MARAERGVSRVGDELRRGSPRGGTTCVWWALAVRVRACGWTAVWRSTVYYSLLLDPSDAEEGRGERALRSASPTPTTRAFLYGWWPPRWRPPQPPLPVQDGGRAGSVRWLARAARARPGRRGEGRSGEAPPAVDGQRAPGLRAPTRSEHRTVGGRRARPPRRCRETKPSGRCPEDPRADPGDTRAAHRPRRATRSRHDLRGHVCHAARHPVGTGEGGTTAAPPLCGRCLPQSSLFLLHHRGGGGGPRTAAGSQTRHS